MLKFLCRHRDIHFSRMFEGVCEIEPNKLYTVHNYCRTTCYTCGKVLYDEHLEYDYLGDYSKYRKYNKCENH
jgi:hypothetical protein